MTEFCPYIKSSILRVILILGLALIISFFIKDAQQSRSILGAAIIAAGIAGAWHIYDINSWPLKKRIGLHTLVMFLVVVLAYLVGDWIKTWTDVWIGLAAFVGNGIVLCSLGYFFFKDK